MRGRVAIQRELALHSPKLRSWARAQNQRILTGLDSSLRNELGDEVLAALGHEPGLELKSQIGRCLVPRSWGLAAGIGEWSAVGCKAV